jgi:MinD-like ATPase involved in chromosome partitioning or flagellar assembly
MAVVFVGPQEVEAQQPLEQQGTLKIAADLAELKRGSRAFEVAHIRDKEHYERLRRRLGIVVVVLTAATGTAVVTALAATTGTVAKVVVGTLSVLSAVVAALNEKGPFADQLQLHAKAASSFNKLHRKAVVLDRSWTTGRVDQKEAERQLTELETAYDELEDAAPDVRAYERAHAWVEGEEREHLG